MWSCEYVPPVQFTCAFQPSPHPNWHIQPVSNTRRTHVFALRPLLSSLFFYSIPFFPRRRADGAWPVGRSYDSKVSQAARLAWGRLFSRAPASAPSPACAKLAALWPGTSPTALTAQHLLMRRERREEKGVTVS